MKELMKVQKLNEIEVNSEFEVIDIEEKLDFLPTIVGFGCNGICPPDSGE